MLTISLRFCAYFITYQRRWRKIKLQMLKYFYHSVYFWLGSTCWGVWTQVQFDFMSFFSSKFCWQKPSVLFFLLILIFVLCKLCFLILLHLAYKTPTLSSILRDFEWLLSDFDLEWRAPILFIQTIALYKSFTYLLTYSRILAIWTKIIITNSSLCFWSSLLFEGRLMCILYAIYFSSPRIF